MRGGAGGGGEGGEGGEGGAVVASKNKNPTLRMWGFICNALRKTKLRMLRYTRRSGDRV